MVNWGVESMVCLPTFPTSFYHYILKSRRVLPTFPMYFLIICINQDWEPADLFGLENHLMIGLIEVNFHISDQWFFLHKFSHWIRSKFYRDDILIRSLWYQIYLNGLQFKKWQFNNWVKEKIFIQLHFKYLD